MIMFEKKNDISHIKLTQKLIEMFFNFGNEEYSIDFDTF
jgi:hypothetical protein